jgi:hypothetical protein
MKYINKQSIPIYIQVGRDTHLINPGQEFTSDASLVDFGLTALPEKEIKSIPTPPKPKKTKKSKTVKTNELPKTNKTKD